MSLLTSKTKSDYFGIGRRKTSVAKVILVPGKGTMVINHKKGEKYLQFNLQYINASKFGSEARYINNICVPELLNALYV